MKKRNRPPRMDHFIIMPFCGESATLVLLWRARAYLSVPESILAETLNRPVDILDAISLCQNHTDVM